MIQSMTGFGKSQFTIQNKSYLIEIRSLNSKQMDIQFKVPGLLKDKEALIRKELTDRLVRGKLDVLISVEYLKGGGSNSINGTALRHYLEQIEAAVKTTNLNIDGHALQAVLRLPDVIVPEKESLDEAEWNGFVEHLNLAIDQMNNFRRQEGVILQQELQNRIQKIEILLSQVDIPEKERIERIKERIKRSLSEVTETDKIDYNRFEQELIYYIEKFDITEEKLRLQTHCKYFIETMKTDPEAGRKLNFIAQELGREINTLGSKANDAILQKIVVEMKDELEKIKEQTFNIL